MARKALTITLKIDGLRETLAKLKTMPKEASDELRSASLQVSTKLADTVRRRALSSGTQAALMAPSVKAVRDRVPNVQAGGSGRVGRRRKPAYKVLFGSEFGATYLKQFRPRNTRGYWFYPSVDEMRTEIDAEWSKAADVVVSRFTEGG